MELLFIYERLLLELNTELPDPPNVTILFDINVSYPAAAQVGGNKKLLLNCCLCAYSCATEMLGNAWDLPVNESHL